MNSTTTVKAMFCAGVSAMFLSATAFAQVRDTRPPTPPPAPQQQARDVAKPDTGKAALLGTVVTDEQTPQPIKRAQITVSNTDLTVTRTTFTNDAGRFTITGLPAGRYTLAASKPPYLRTNYGAKRYDRLGTPITLKEAEQMPNLTLRMTRGAVLSGTITDENGAPASGVTVRALQLRVQNGERTYVSVAASGSTFETTDDRGMYRFFGLPPGDYTVNAQPRLSSGEIKAMTESEIRAVMQALAQQNAQTPGTGAAPQAPQQRDAEATTVAYAGVFYPGATTATSASTVTIAAGEERRGVDFPLRLVRTARVEGIIVPPPGVAPQAVQIMMMPATTSGGAAASTAAIEIMAMNRVVPGPDGKFQFTGVAPGDYTISARVNGIPPGAPPPPPPPPPPPGGGQGQVVGFTRTVMATGGAGEAMTMDFIGPAMGGGGPVFWGQADVSVDGNPISGISISMQPGMTIAGKVQFKGTRLVQDGDLSRIRLTLAPAPSAAGTAARLNMGGLPGAVVEANGQFRFTGVTPGRYRVIGFAPVPMGSAPGLSWTMQSAVANGRDLLDFPLEIGPTGETGEIVVTFADAVQEVNGTLQDPAGRPAPEHTIIVFAADNRFWTTPTRRVRSTRPGTDGKFTVTGLPPGEYRMAAVVDVSPTEITDPLFLEQLVAGSVKITLAEGEKKTQDLKISGGL